MEELGWAHVPNEYEFVSGQVWSGLVFGWFGLRIHLTRRLEDWRKSQGAPTMGGGDMSRHFVEFGSTVHYNQIQNW